MASLESFVFLLLGVLNRFGLAEGQRLAAGFGLRWCLLRSIESSHGVNQSINRRPHALIHSSPAPAPTQDRPADALLAPPSSATPTIGYHNEQHTQARACGA